MKLLNDIFISFLEALKRDTQKTYLERLKALRTQAIVEMLYATGLRVSELITLKRALIFYKTNLIKIIGKGNKERLVPVNDLSWKVLEEYDEFLYQNETVKKKNKEHSSWLFPSDGLSGHITRQVVARDIKFFAIKAGLNSDTLSPHVFRHAFASHLVQNGADLRVVQELMGHADITSTQIYTHVLDKQALEMVKELHPLGFKENS